MLSSKGVTEFQRLWKDHYDEELSEEQARTYAESLLRYVELVLSPDDESPAASGTLKPS